MQGLFLKHVLVKIVNSTLNLLLSRNTGEMETRTYFFGPFHIKDYMWSCLRYCASWPLVFTSYNLGMERLSASAVGSLAI